MDLTNYYELKHQPHNLRLLAHTAGAGLNAAGAGLEQRLALPPPSSSAVSRKTAADDDDVLLPHHFLDGAPPKIALIGGADGRASDHHTEELYKERSEVAPQTLYSLIFCAALLLCVVVLMWS